MESIENLEDMKGHTVKEWVSQEPTRVEIYNRFKNFLCTYVDDTGKNHYKEKIKQMCESKIENIFVFIFLKADCILAFLTCRTKESAFTNHTAK